MHTDLGIVCVVFTGESDGLDGGCGGVVEVEWKAGGGKGAGALGALWGCDGDVFVGSAGGC